MVAETNTSTDTSAELMAAGQAAPRALVRELADRLGETAAGPRHQLGRVVAVLGEARARALLAEALALEEQGGLLLPDGSRRRTPGGVFFHLVRTGVAPDERKAIFVQGRGPRQAGAAAAPATLAFTWDDYGALAPTLARGELSFGAATGDRWRTADRG